VTVHPSVSYEARGLLGIKAAVPQGSVVVDVELLWVDGIVLGVEEEKHAVLEIVLGFVQVLLVLVLILECEPHQVTIVIVHVRIRVLHQPVILRREDVGRLPVFRWKTCTIENVRSFCRRAKCAKRD